MNTTLASMSLRLARQVIDVLESKATAGDQVTLTDSLNLIQADQYFDKGTLWILSGDHAGIVSRVTKHVQNVLTFADIGAPSIGVGERYAVARGAYPWETLVSALNDALAETFVVIEAQPETPILGDGETLEFTLPDGVANVASVILENTDDASDYYTSTHWDEREGSLIFDTAPGSTQKIRIFYRAEHPTLAAAADKINSQINADWLLWKATEYALYWGMKIYGEQKEYRIEELLNRALTRQKGLYPRKPVTRIRTMS